MTLTGYSLLQFPIQTPLDSSGLVVGAAVAKFYLAGTTTPQNVYAYDGTPLGTTVTADANGRFPAIYLNPLIALKVDLQDSNGVSLSGYPVDHVAPVPYLPGGTTGSPLVAVTNSNPVWGGDVDYRGSLLQRSQLQGFIETVQALSIASNVLTVDYSLGNVIKFTLNANITTMTLSNLPASGKFASLLFEMLANGSVFTWAWLTSTVKWSSGIAPSLTSTNGKRDVFIVWTDDGGTNWYGSIVGQSM